MECVLCNENAKYRQAEENFKKTQDKWPTNILIRMWTYEEFSADLAPRRVDMTQVSAEKEF